MELLMTKRNARKETFANVLCSLYEQFYDDDFDVNNFSMKVMAAFLQLGPGALHHERYGEIIEFGKARINDPDEEIYGLKIVGKDIFLSSILNMLENIKPPEVVLERFPDITEEEWRAAIRISTDILVAFDPAKPISVNQK